MTDEELIARLREEGYDHFGRTSANLAANRIEALIDERDEQIEWVKRLADDLIAAEAKLAKAVEAAFCEGFAEGYDGTWVEGDYTHAWKKSHALANLEKTK